jgi:hypothetical protein
MYNLKTKRFLSVILIICLVLPILLAVPNNWVQAEETLNPENSSEAGGTEDGEPVSDNSDDNASLEGGSQDQTPSISDMEQPSGSQVTEGQTEGSETVNPVIHHEPIQSVKNTDDMKVTTQVSHLSQTAQVEVHYKSSHSAQTIKEASMISTNGTDYEAVIPQSELIGEFLHYGIVVKDESGNILTSYPENMGDMWKVSIQPEAEVDFNQYPSLIITELLPNSQNVGSKDGYEFIEVYNNTDQSINLKDYEIIYRYPNNSQLVWDLTEDKWIPSQETFVVWIHNSDNKGKTLADFNEALQASVTEGQLTIIESDGMANSSERTLIISKDGGIEISAASYVKEEVKENQGMEYKAEQSQVLLAKIGLNEKAAPGRISEGQVPSQPVKMIEDNEPPAIAHVPVLEADGIQNMSLQAEVKDNEKVQKVWIYYKRSEEEEFIQAEMVQSKENPAEYHAEIPSDQLISTELTYYIEVTDGTNISKTESFKVNVKQDKVQFHLLPPFLVTEVVPDSTNVNGKDGYEFIEVYNNTNKDINFKDYKLQYRYPMDGPQADLIWSPEKEDIVIKSGQTMVFWIINGANNNKTVNDFNTHYGSALVENENIVKMYNNGMSNSSGRGIVIATNTGKEISAVYYLDQPNVDDVHADKGIMFKYPLDGTTKSVKISGGVDPATPGSVLSVQIPAKRVELSEDTSVPIAANLTEQTMVTEQEDIHIKAEVQDASLKTVTLFYKDNTQSVYKQVYLRESYDDGLYHYTIYSPDLIGKKEITYYLTASDGTNEVKTEEFTIEVSHEAAEQGLRLNVKDGKVVTKETIMKATADQADLTGIQLFIDNQEVTDTYPTTEKDLYFAFDVNKTNLYFQNGVTVGSEVLKIFDDTINGYVTMMVPISLETLQKANYTISLRSGTKVSPFDENSEENRDDYYVKNVRLVLADGTAIRDPKHADPEIEITMNDANAVRSFMFTVPPQALTSKAYKWNTATVSEGAHVIKAAEANGNEVSAEIMVDNTAPAIVPAIEEGKEYKGTFTIDAAVSDEIAGVETVKAILDNEPIQLPMETSSASLKPGEHELVLSAADKVGNENRVTISFTVADEHPMKPEPISPQNGEGEVRTNAELTVKVTDPTNDDMDVTFYQGFKYDAKNRNALKAFKNEADIEPPREMTPEGEQDFTDADYTLVAKEDGQYLETNSMTKFPYQRFSVKLDSAVDQDDAIEVVWKGKTLDGRKVTMYGWNHQKGNWSIIDYKIGSNEDFILKGNVNAADYVKNNEIQMMIQDEVASPSAGMDYTFVWMSDTQYYSASYPHIYEKQVQWIKENQETFNIQYVFHTGDLVDDAEDPSQWYHADTKMKVLDDANIPYGVLAGNHDVGHKTGSYDNYYQYFGDHRFNNRPYYGESYKNNRGHYDLISANGNDYIMVYMGWGVAEEDILWMNEVLAKYPDRMAILAFHEYLLVSGNRSPLGDKIYEQVVVPNHNVMAVLSGHYHDSEKLIDEIDDNGDGQPDRKVYQMLADYQGGPEGGQGYMRLMEIDAEENKIYMKTYSPYMNDYNYYDPILEPGKDEFVIDMNLEPKEKRVATDYFEVNVYTNQAISQQKKAVSGSEIKGAWTGLKDNADYYWYATAEDEFGGKSVSDIWHFTTGKKSDSGGSSPKNPSSSGNDKPSTSVPNNPHSQGTIVEEKGTSKRTLVVTKEKIADQLTANNEQIRLTMINQPEETETLTLQLNEKIVEELIKQSKDMVFETDSVEVTLPKQVIKSAAVEDTGDLQVTIMKQAHSVPLIGGQQFASHVYDFMVKKGTKEIHDFAAPVGVILSLNEQIKNNRKLAAYYYNEQQKNWEYVGGKVEKQQLHFTTNHFSAFAAIYNEKTFADIQTNVDWAKEEIEVLASRQIIRGVTEDSFRPFNTVTRGQFASLLVRTLHLPLKEYEGIFGDVFNTSFVSQEIEAAQRAGIITGHNGLFKANEPVTRQQAAAMMMRAVAYKQKQTTASTTNLVFHDYSEISDYAKEHVEQAARLGIIKGKNIDGNTYFLPYDYTTRAQGALMIYRFLEVMDEF